MLKLLKNEDFESAAEIVIYFAIENLGDLVFTLHRAVKYHGAKLEDVQVDIDAAIHDQKQLVVYLVERGFDFGDVTEDLSEYKKWYHWWRNWHQGTLSDEDWDAVNALLKEGDYSEEAFKDWRPEGDWKNFDPDALVEVPAPPPVTEE